MTKLSGAPDYATAGNGIVGGVEPAEAGDIITRRAGVSYGDFVTQCPCCKVEGRSRVSLRTVDLVTTECDCRRAR